MPSKYRDILEAPLDGRRIVLKIRRSRVGLPAVVKYSLVSLFDHEEYSSNTCVRKLELNANKPKTSTNVINQIRERILAKR